MADNEFAVVNEAIKFPLKKRVVNLCRKDVETGLVPEGTTSDREMAVVEEFVAQHRSGELVLTYSLASL